MTVNTVRRGSTEDGRVAQRRLWVGRLTILGVLGSVITIGLICGVGTDVGASTTDPLVQVMASGLLLIALGGIGLGWTGFRLTRRY